MAMHDQVALWLEIGRLEAVDGQDGQDGMRSATGDGTRRDGNAHNRACRVEAGQLCDRPLNL